MTIHYPQSYSNPTLDAFLVKFFQLSDLPPPATNDPYVEEFTDDAYVKVGPAEAVGKHNLVEYRKNSWVGIDKRHHVIDKVFPFSSSQDETQDIIVKGTVEYTRDGSVSAVEFMSHLMIKGWKIAHYKVYISPNKQ
jgi:hypothetical protein